MQFSLIWRILQEYRLQISLSKVKFTWSKVQGSRLTFILPLIISCLFLILSKMSMNKEIWKKFVFAFAFYSKSFAIACAVNFLFLLLTSVFELPNKSVFGTFDWLLLHARVAVSSDTHAKKCVVNVQLIWNFLCENIYMQRASEKITVEEVNCSICKTVCEVVICDTCGP